ncbi:MAG: CHAT domain-containing protein [Gemmatimonadaceae bacterium]|nr:CHAT domain-containing protein [Gemmatimonadaceae bacterium]
MSVLPPLAAVVFAGAVLQSPFPDAYTIVRRATRAVETDSVAQADAYWTRVLTRQPNDRSALLSLATLAQGTARLARADSFAVRLLGTSDVLQAVARPDVYTVLARFTLARTLASGATPQRADSALVVARKEAQQIGVARLESSILVALAQLRARSGGPRPALAVLRESRTVYPKATPSEEALRLCLEGSAATLAGDTVQAASLRRGMLVAWKSKEWRVYADCRILQAQMLEARGFFEESIHALDDAAVWLRRLHADVTLAAALQRGAYVKLQRGLFSTARRDFLEALMLARRVGNRSVEAWGTTGLGQLALALNDLTGAQGYLAAALTMHRAANDQWGVASVRYLQGELFDAVGNVAAAREALTEVVDTYARTGQRLLAIAPLRRLARLELGQGRIDDAERHLTRATQFANATRNTGWLAELPYHQAGVAIARGRYATADSLLRTMSYAEARDVYDDDLAYSYFIRVANVAARRGDFADAERALDRAQAVLARWRAGFDDKDTRLRIAQARQPWGNTGEEYPALIARLASAGRVPAAFRLAEATRARELTTTALQQTALSLDPKRDLLALDRIRRARVMATSSDVQQSLDDSTALLTYVAGRGAAPTTLFVVTRRTITAKALPPIDSIGTTVDRLVRLLADGVLPRALSRQLGDAVLNPALPALDARITKLIVVPELALYRVPFDALEMPDGRLALERFSISLSPSATLALAATSVTRAQATQAPQSGRTVLAFGDVSYSASTATARVRTVGSTNIQELPRLPFSGDEVRRVAQYAPRARVLLRAQASETALRTADLRQVSVLHLATHAIVDDRSLQGNVLALAPSSQEDGRVGPDELSGLQLNRALVVLSGCRTVGGLVLGGEGLRGLVAPLLEAGAASIVATQWPVGDESILPMVDRFYAKLARGVSVTVALQQAKAEAIRDGVPPSVWAAFVVVGDGGLRVALRPASSAPLPWATKRAGP